MKYNKQSFGCLLPNEEIIVKDGIKKICDLDASYDKVLGHDGEYHDIEMKWCFDKPVYYLALSNGDHIECSNTHRLLVNKSKIDKEVGWKSVGELHDGDEIFIMSIVNETGQTRFVKTKISRMFKSGDSNQVMDLTIKGCNTYISANGVINHSF